MKTVLIGGHLLAKHDAQGMRVVGSVPARFQNELIAKGIVGGITAQASGMAVVDGQGQLVRRFTEGVGQDRLHSAVGEARAFPVTVCMVKGVIGGSLLCEDVAQYHEMCCGNLQSAINAIDASDELAHALYRLEKAANPLTPEGYLAITNSLGRQLANLSKPATQAHIRGILGLLGRNWKGMTAAQRESALSAVSVFVPASKWASVSASFTSSLSTSAREVMGEVKKQIGPDLGISARLNLQDTEAIKALVKDQNFYVRNQAGRVSMSMANKSRGIIEQGLREGLGAGQIGDNLRSAVGVGYEQQMKNYWTVVAHNLVARSRSRAQLHGFMEAGITEVIAYAVMDERTTEWCFSGETKVKTELGEKRIDSIDAGDVVVTGSGVLRHVLAVSKRFVDEELIEVQLQSGNHLIATKKHRILTADGWRPIGELRKGDSLVYREEMQGLRKDVSSGGEQGSVLRHGLLQQISDEQCGNGLSMVRQGIHGKAVLCETGADEALFGSVQGGSWKEGVESGIVGEAVRCMWGGVQNKASGIFFRENPHYVFTGMPVEGSKGNDNVRGVREKVCYQEIGSGQEAALFAQMPFDWEGGNGVGRNRCGSVGKESNQLRAREARRPIQCRFLSTGARSRNRGGRGVLAQGRVQGGCDGKKRTSNCRHGVETDQDYGRAIESRESGERSVEEYCRGTRLEKVVAVRKVRRACYVYNLEVEDDPTYIAEGVVVHNCRYIHGKVIDVEVAHEHQTSTDNLADPEDIKFEMPWVRRRGADWGVMNKQGQFNSIMTVTKPGAGTWDAGKYASQYSTVKEMRDLGMSLPPYHPLCRTTVIYNQKAIQTAVPGGLGPWAGGAAAARTAAAVPKPAVPAPLKPHEQPWQLVPEEGLRGDEVLGPLSSTRPPAVDARWGSARKSGRVDQIRKRGEWVLKDLIRKESSGTLALDSVAHHKVAGEIAEKSLAYVETIPEQARLFGRIKAQFLDDAGAYAQWSKIPKPVRDGIEEGCAIYDYVTRYGRGVVRGRLPAVRVDVDPTKSGAFYESAKSIASQGVDERAFISIGTKNVRVRKYAEWSKEEVRRKFLHEYGHHFDELNSDSLKNGQWFLWQRAKVDADGFVGGETPLRYLTRNKAYKLNEIVVKVERGNPEFTDHYVGRLYYREGTVKTPRGGSVKDLDATEVTSMGMEYFDGKSAGKVMQDVDHFTRVLGSINTGAYK